MATNREILTEARRLIQDVGFCKGRMRWLAADCDTDVLAYCTMGAIIYAGIRLNKTYQSGDEALAIFQASLGVSDVPSWNDHPERTKSEVLSQFLIAIDICEE